MFQIFKRNLFLLYQQIVPYLTKGSFHIRRSYNTRKELNIPFTIAIVNRCGKHTRNKRKDILST